jgi:hypothetical protein
MAAECPTCHGKGFVVCDRCHGTGEITVEEGEVCPYCLGSGRLTPTITLKSSTAWKSDGVVSVRAMVENEEELPTYAKYIAEVKAGGTTYTGTTEGVLRPHEETAMVVTIDNIPTEDYNKIGTMMQYNISLSEVEDITCSHCDGTGYISGTVECPICGGTGVVDCSACGGTGIYGGGEQSQGLNIPDIGGIAVGVVVVAGVAIAAVVVVKKRKTSEKDLRKLPPPEFQNWVLKKLAGKPPSLRDSSIGIDGYTMEGQPISIKQSDGIGRDVIDKFASAMGQSRAKNGTIVAYSFGNDAYTAKVRAKLNYGLEIQMVTVNDLIAGRSRSL